MKSVAVCVLGLMISACGVDHTRPSPLPLHSYTIDSAGLTIVENVAPPLQLWAEQTPSLDIARLFHVSDARRMPDGTTLVANAGTQQILLYDAQGRLVRTVGTSGEGPGQFRLPQEIATLGLDSFAVWDAQQRRLTTFDRSGRVVRHVAAARRATNPSLLAVFTDGSFMIHDERLAMPRSGFGEQRITLVRYGPDGGLLDSIADVTAGPIGRLGESGMLGSPLFAPRTAIAATGNGDRVMLGGAEQYELAMVGADGRLLSLVRWTGPDRAVAPGDIEAHWADRLRTAPDADRRTAVQHVRAVTPVAQQVPAYGRFVAGSDGTLWVEAFRRPSDTGPARWWSFDAAGRFQALAELPAGFYPTDGGADWVLGLARERDGEHVRLYRLVAVQP